MSLGDSSYSTSHHPRASGSIHFSFFVAHPRFPPCRAWTEISTCLPTVRVWAIADHHRIYKHGSIDPLSTLLAANPQQPRLAEIPFHPTIPVDLRAQLMVGHKVHISHSTSAEPLSSKAAKQDWPRRPPTQRRSGFVRQWLRLLHV